MHNDGQKRVSVAVRVRPILRSGGSHTHQQERFELEAVTRLSDNQLQVAEQKQDEACRSSSFTFDYIFDQESTQLEVYEEAVVDLVDTALNGNNATILAYGQTGSGKTHTVLGDVKPNPLENDLLTNNSGLFLRVLSDLMEYKAKRKDKMHVIVGLSCVEIYNETIRDLFGGKPGDPPPNIRAVMTNDDVFLPSLIVKEVTSLQAVFNEIQLAIGRRQSRSTESNAASSRSHCLFMIDILQQAVSAPPPSLNILAQQMNKESSSTSKDRRRSTTPSATAAAAAAAANEKKNESGFSGTILTVPGQSEPIYCSKILLADLAGSEKPQKSGVTGEGLAEATAINSSLTALGNVVHSLYEGGYVSYRTSNLTRLLKPTFSQPSSRVLLLAQVSPTQLTFDETVSTLHFANKVKAMKVTTTTGGEAEKLQFDVIETERIHDALLADLRIFTTDTGCKTIMRRKFAGLFKKPYYGDGKTAKKPYKPKERIGYLDSQGIVAAAQKEKAQMAADKAEKESKKKEQFAAEVQVECSNIVNVYLDQAKELKDKLRSSILDVNASNQQIVSNDASVQNVIMKTEEEIDRIGMMQKFFVKAQQHYQKQQSKIEAEVARLTQQVADVQSKGVAAGNEDLRREDEAISAKYAETTWFHCSGKRFFYALQELREAQIALLTIKLSIAEITNWQDRVEKEKAAAEAAAKTK